MEKKMRINLYKLKKISKKAFLFISFIFMFPLLIAIGWYACKYWMYRKYRLGVRAGKIKESDFNTKPIDLI